VHHCVEQKQGGGGGGGGGLIELQLRRELGDFSGKQFGMADIGFCFPGGITVQRRYVDGRARYEKALCNRGVVGSCSDTLLTF